MLFFLIDLVVSRFCALLFYFLWLFDLSYFYYLILWSISFFLYIFLSDCFWYCLSRRSRSRLDVFLIHFLSIILLIRFYTILMRMSLMIIITNILHDTIYILSNPSLFRYTRLSVDLLVILLLFCRLGLIFRMLFNLFIIMSILDYFQFIFISLYLFLYVCRDLILFFLIFLFYIFNIDIDWCLLLIILWFVLWFVLWFILWFILWFLLLLKYFLFLLLFQRLLQLFLFLFWDFFQIMALNNWLLIIF